MHRHISLHYLLEPLFIREMQTFHIFTASLQSSRRAKASIKQNAVGGIVTDEEKERMVCDKGFRG